MQKSDLKKMPISIEMFELWNLLRQVRDLSAWYEDNLYSKTKITPQQFLVLWTMKFLGELKDSPVTIRDLLPPLTRSHNSISQILNRMVKEGLVQKIRDLPDQRSVRLIITPKGNSIFNSTSDTNMRLIKGLLSVYSAKEIKTMLMLSEKLKSRLAAKLRLEPGKVEPKINGTNLIAFFFKDQMQ